VSPNIYEFILVASMQFGSLSKEKILPVKFPLTLVTIGIIPVPLPRSAIVSYDLRLPYTY